MKLKKNKKKIIEELNKKYKILFYKTIFYRYSNNAF
jgi:hypothetical protein